MYYTPSINLFGAPFVAQSGDLVAIIGVSIIGTCFLIVCLGIMLAVVIRAFRGGSRKDSELEGREAELIQELHAGLMRMEDRVESLETILIDRMERPKKAEGQHAGDQS